MASGADRRGPFEGYAFDLDGTIHIDEVALPGAVEAVGKLRSRGARIVFVTNKPLDVATGYAAKLSRLGIPATVDDVVTALDALQLYLLENHAGARLAFISEPLVAEVLLQAGFKAATTPDTADVVVVSFDRTFDYDKLNFAFQAVRAGAVIVATNPDPYCPTADGGIPDCAAMLAALEACTEKRAEAVVGKPSRHMAEAVLQRLGVPADQVAMVGDRLGTDIAMGIAADMAGVLVLTGATSRADLDDSVIRPHAVIDSLTDLL